MSTSVDVAVVGAGVSGLHCARTLASAGLSVVVLERDDDVGGRVRTDEIDGFLIDRGFQVLPTAYPEARRAPGLDALDLRPFASGAIVRRGGRFRRVADPRRMPLRALRSLAAEVVTPRDAIAVPRLLRDRPEETTIDDALRRAGLSDGAREAFLAPFLRGITLEPGLATSSRFLPFVLGTFARGPAALPADGMRAIPRRLADGLDVRLSCPVSAVGPGVVTLADGPLRARAVVVATPGLIDEAASGWNGVSSVSFAAPGPPLPGPWLVLDGDAGGPVNNLCVPSEVAPAYAPPGRSLVTASVLGSGEPDLDAVVAQLRSWFGRAVDRWSHLATVTVPHALPRYPAGADLRAPSRLAPRLYACGDHREHPSLNGALASGRLAADAVLADLA